MAPFFTHWLNIGLTGIGLTMGWFHFTKQERLKQSRQDRREHAEKAKRLTSENIYLIPHEIEPALKIAMDEERSFEEYFGEKMPSHMKEALNVEIQLWNRLNKAINDTKTKRITEDDYKLLAEKIRSYLTPLIDLLHAEEEMLTSCLQVHYVHIVRDLQVKASAVGL